MAELSADEAQRLARLFLTGKAGAAELSRINVALPEDQTLALELLAQMQNALDDVAPSALSVEQDKSVDARIEALIAPRIKKRGFFGWLRKLFRGAPKPAEEPSSSRRRRKGAEPPPAPVAAVPEPSLPLPSAAVGDGLEEMMPGSEPAAPAVSEAPAAPPKPAAPKAERKSLPWKALGLGLLLLALLAGLAYGVRAWLARPRPAPAVVADPLPTAVPSAVPTPLPSPTPVVNAQPVRARAMGSDSDEPLPSLLPPGTPQPAGLLSPEP